LTPPKTKFDLDKPFNISLRPPPEKHGRTFCPLFPRPCHDHSGTTTTKTRITKTKAAKWKLL